MIADLHRCLASHGSEPTLAPMAAPIPTLETEHGFLATGARLVAGLDEVGRGAIAGPVMVGVVCVDASHATVPEGLRDSKLMTPKRRTAMVPVVEAWAHSTAVGEASAAEAGPDSPPVEAEPEVPAPTAPTSPAGAIDDDSERVRISPLAARLAREKGVDPATIEGSGPNGRIIKADIDRTLAAAAPPVPSEPVPAPRAAEPAKGETLRVELDRTQQTIARRMAESKATVPHFYLRTVVDMTRAVEVRDAFKAASEPDVPVPSLNDMVVKAAALALRHHPRANSSYRDGAIDLFSRINVGIAVASRNALIVPVISDADHLELRQIAIETRRLAERVRTGEVTPPELSGGTFSSGTRLR